MKTIKIMIAASEELHDEKIGFSNLLAHLNEVLMPRGIELERIKWDPNNDGSIEEYKKKLHDCEMCLSLYWRELAGNSKEELNTAYRELKNGRNPHNLYVFFKETNGELTAALKDFKANFVANYGHFFCKFENVDTMNLHFILQFESYQNCLRDSQEKYINVKNGKVEVGGKKIIDLENISFTAFNKECQRLRMVLAEFDNQILEVRGKYRADPNNEELEDEFVSIKLKRKKIAEELDKYLNHLYDIALDFARRAGEHYSERMIKAREQFEMGDTVEADKLLNMEEMRREAEKELQQFEQNNKNLELKIDEFSLKAETVFANVELSLQDRYEQACEAYEEAIRIAEKIHFEDKRFASILFCYATRLYELNKKTESITYYLKALEKQRVLATLSDEQSLVDIAMMLNNLACAEEAVGYFKEAEKDFVEAMKIRKQLADIDSQTYSFWVANSLLNIAGLQYRFEKFEEAENNWKKALDIFRDSEDCIILEPHLLYVAKTLNNLAVLHERFRLFDDAESEYNEALVIYRRLCENESDVYGKEVAEALNNLASLYGASGRFKEAEKNFEEAVAICQRLSDSAPEVFLPIEANILCNRANFLTNIGRLEEAYQDYEDVLYFYDLLYDTEPDMYTPKIADVLSKVAHLQHLFGLNEEAIDSIGTSLRVYRRLAEDYPDVYLREVAATLNDYSNIQQSVECYHDAEEGYLEALGIYRQLLEYHREVYFPCMSNVLDNLATLHSKMGKFDEAKREFDEALAVRKMLSDTCPDKYLPDVAQTQSHIASMQYKLGRYEDAVELFSHALEIYQHLSVANPEVYGVEVVKTINDLACTKRKTGAKEEVIELLSMAFDICEDLKAFIHNPEIVESIIDNINLVTDEDS